MMEIHPEHTRVEPEEKPKLIFPVVIWLCIIVLSIFVALQLTGCSQATFKGMCALQPAGMTDSGVSVFHTYCEAS